MTLERGAAIKKGRRSSKKAVGRHKRPLAVKKGREGCYGRLVRAADIKKGLEDGRGLPQSHEGRSGHLVCTADITKGRKGCHGGLQGHQDCFEDTTTFFPNLQCRCTAVRFRFSRMQGTWLRQVPRIRENRKRTAVHRITARPRIPRSGCS